MSSRGAFFGRIDDPRYQKNKKKNVTLYVNTALEYRVAFRCIDVSRHANMGRPILYFVFHYIRVLDNQKIFKVLSAGRPLYERGFLYFPLNESGRLGHWIDAKVMAADRGAKGEAMRFTARGAI